MRAILKGHCFSSMGGSSWCPVFQEEIADQSGCPRLGFLSAFKRPSLHLGWTSLETDRDTRRLSWASISRSPLRKGILPKVLWVCLSGQDQR